jgi:hypothetical protein
MGVGRLDDGPPPGLFIEPVPLPSATTSSFAQTHRAADCPAKECDSAVESATEPPNADDTELRLKTEVFTKGDHLMAPFEGAKHLIEKATGLRRPLLEEVEIGNASLS